MQTLTPPIVHQAFFPPHPSLAGVINNIMVNSVVTSGPIPPSFPFPPLPEHFILFYPHQRPMLTDIRTGRTRPGYACTVVGPQTERFQLTLGVQHLVIKIGLQPGALFRLLHVPMFEMLEYKDLDGELLFGSSVRSVLDEFANAKMIGLVILVEVFLIRASIPG